MSDDCWNLMLDPEQRLLPENSPRDCLMDPSPTPQCVGSVALPQGKHVRHFPVIWGRSYASLPTISPNPKYLLSAYHVLWRTSMPHLAATQDMLHV